MFDRIKALMHRWHDLNEIARLSQRELDDLGMTRDQVEAFVRMPEDVPDRVIAMAQIFGLTEAQVRADHDRYHELLYTCGQCKDRKNCGKVLARGALAMPSDAEFCLNKANFAAGLA
jgi:hypothetical protein